MLRICAYSYNLLCVIQLISLGSLFFLKGNVGLLDLGERGNDKGLGGVRGVEVSDRMYCMTE